MEPFIDGRAILVADMDAYRHAEPARWEAVVFLLQPSMTGRAPTSASSAWSDSQVKRYRLKRYRFPTERFSSTVSLWSRRYTPR